MSDSKTFTLNFGEAIAFVAPGFLAFNAISYFSATAHNWLAVAASKDGTVGLFLFVLLGSAALGIAVSGIRAWAIDRLLQKAWGIGPPQIKWGQVDDRKRENLNLMIQGFYRYYQFYSNSLVALLILMVARLSVGLTPDWSVWIWGGVVLTGLAIVYVLFWSAKDSYSNYVKAVNNLFSGASQKEEP